MAFTETKNKWKDILILPKGDLPGEEVVLPYNLPEEGKLVFQDIAQRITKVELQDKTNLSLIVSSKRQGNIWSTEPEKWPLVSVDKDNEANLSCACVCLFVQDDSKEKEPWLIAVKPKTRRYLMNPAGYVETSDKDIQSAARREVLEETGIDLKEQTLKPLCSSEYETTYYNLQWKVIVTSYFACISLDMLPSDWRFKGTDKKPYKIEQRANEEIEEVVLIPRCVLLKKREMLKLGLGSHHLLIAQTASGQAMPVPQSVKSLTWS